MQSVSRRAFAQSVLAGAALTPLLTTPALTAISSGRLIRLDSNENPYGPSRRAQRAAREAVKAGAYYGFDRQYELRQTLANALDVSIDSVALSTGSNEALCAASSHFGRRGPLIAPALTYKAHLSYARRVGVTLNTIPLKADLSIDLNAMEIAASESAGLVYVCNPNNPTGLALDTAELREFCRRVGKKTTVLVDEAYIELAEDPASSSVIDLVRNNENLIITRTFSKIFGLAGMRIGYAIARPDLLKVFKGEIMSWPNSVGVAAANASYTDKDFIDYSRQKIIEARLRVTAAFEKKGLSPLPSATNFMFANINRNAEKFATTMRDNGVLIRGDYPDYPSWIRVSMGRLSDIRVFERRFDALLS